MKQINIIFLILILLSCEEDLKKNDDLSELFEYDSKNKKILIDFNRIKNYDVKLVELRTKNNSNHFLHLDSLKRIDNIQNGIKEAPNGKYLNNTWYAFDAQSNLKTDFSFYYDVYVLGSDDGDSNYIAYESLFTLYDGKQYAVVGDYDKYFNLKNPAEADTFWMDEKESIILIPVDTRKIKPGWHNIKFIAYEDKREGKIITRKRTFVNKDYFVQFEKKKQTKSKK